MLHMLWSGTLILSYLHNIFFIEYCTVFVNVMKLNLIGCFEETDVNVLTKKSHEMYFPSVGRCQEVCLASNYSVFGLQVTLSVCQLVFTNKTLSLI